MEEKFLYFSTNLKSGSVLFNEALLRGQAPDKGLYMPVDIPRISPEEIREMAGMEYHEIAALIIGKYLRGVISQPLLEKMTAEAYDFEIPLEHVADRKYVMRLDQGPTASFKDFAGRMMGRLMQYYNNDRKQDLLILTATSGDTGSAIANAFYKLNRIKALVLFPKDEITARQRKQMTTLGENISIIGLDAKFDDCQALVKQAFSDPGLSYLNLSSANSINIGRLIPQTVYYFYSYARLSYPPHDEPVVFSVPSGNFGDMMGGILAARMGLPVSRFVIATNENDEFPKFLETGNYKKIVPSRNCISSAMNVGHPSNLARLIALYDGVMDETGNILKKPDLSAMQKDIFAVSISDNETKATIKNAWQDHRLLLEPHGAVGWLGLQKYLESSDNKIGEEHLCISLETAHPAKFPEQIREILEFDPELPPSLEGLELKPEKFDTIPNDYEAFKSYLKSKY